MEHLAIDIEGLIGLEGGNDTNILPYNYHQERETCNRQNNRLHIVSYSETITNPFMQLCICHFSKTIKFLPNEILLTILFR